MPERSRTDGFSLVELIFALALASLLVGLAVPVVGDVVDRFRTAGAARYLAGRVMRARMEAIKRSTPVALRFEMVASEYVFRCYADGNGNGVRTADIQQGIDAPLTPEERLGDNFPDVRFELMPGLADIDGVSGRAEGVRIGIPRILTVSPDGTATSGTLYIRGRRAQYAVRVLGATGRTRVFQYNPGDRTWISR